MRQRVRRVQEVLRQFKQPREAPMSDRKSLRDVISEHADSVRERKRQLEDELDEVDAELEEIDDILGNSHDDEDAEEQPKPVQKQKGQQQR